MSFHTTNENPAAPIRMRLSDAQVAKASISGRLYLRPILLSDMAFVFPNAPVNLDNASVSQCRPSIWFKQV
jgi:hypothetical protein